MPKEVLAVGTSHVPGHPESMAQLHMFFDGSFVAQPGRNAAEKAYYLSSRIHPTAAMVLALGMSRPGLRIQGCSGRTPP